jgi:hypothetical protein
MFFVDKASSENHSLECPVWRTLKFCGTQKPGSSLYKRAQVMICIIKVQQWCRTYSTATGELQHPANTCRTSSKCYCAIGKWHGWELNNCSQWWCRERIFQLLRCYCHWSYPQGNPPTGCSCCNCRLNMCRLLHCHHCCCCCCMYRKYWNHHGQSNWCWDVGAECRKLSRL